MLDSRLGNAQLCHQGALRRYMRGQTGALGRDSLGTLGASHEGAN